jgi:hypothetical protein
MTLTLESGGTEEQILKVDTLGRVRRTAEQREAILDEFERSGMSGTGFTAHYGIKYTTFACWVQARRRRRRRGAKGKSKAGKKSTSLALTEVTVEGTTASGGLLGVELPGGVRLDIRDEGGVRLAAELIQRLRGEGQTKPC